MAISTSSVSACPRVPLVLGHSLESPRTTQRPFLTPTTTHKSLQIQFSAYNPPHANPYKSTKDLILPPLKLDPPQFISSSTPDPRSPGRMMEPKSQPMDTHFAGSLDLQLGLPSVEDLTPLHQTLITPELASAFGITPTTCSTKFLREPCEPLKLFPERSESEGGKVRRRADETSGDAGGGSDDCYSGGDESGSSNRAVKRPRLVWTPQLHKRFVDVIDELGVDKAVPKTIMEMMNVEGLTRENVASHLQKYRLYLKKGNSNSSPISISSTSTGGRASTSSAFECGNGGFGPLPLPSGMHFNPMTMVPLPPPAMLMGPTPFRYGVGQLAPGGSGKVGFCGMESGGFNSSMLWNRHGG